MRRRSVDVVQELLDDMNHIVTDYHADVRRTPTAVVGLIDGTAFFAGGTGLWRGATAGGTLPEYFPMRPVMFVAHNFGDVASLRNGIINRGEAHSTFEDLWSNLLGFISHADLQLEECFFTNALMGLHIEGRSGPLPSTPTYKKQSARYLIRQLEIVAPRAVVLLGGDAKDNWKRAVRTGRNMQSWPAVSVMHPAARASSRKPNLELWRAMQGAQIRALLQQQLEQKD